MTRVLAIVVVGAAMSITAAAPAGATSSVTLDGSYSVTVTKPDFTTRCPAGTADECGVFQMAGLGAADYAYVYGPTFEPTDRKGCFHVDGSFPITPRVGQERNLRAIDRRLLRARQLEPTTHHAVVRKPPRRGGHR
jgi:hypothetical protein